LLNRQIPWQRTLKDFVDVPGSTSPLLRPIHPIRHESPVIDESPLDIDRGYARLRREIKQPPSME